MKHFPIMTCVTITIVFLCLQSSFLAEAASSSGGMTRATLNETQWPCPDVQFCTEVAECCQLGVDEYGWIAAAVGWSLWFLTLILLCLDKVMKLRPDEPKYLQA